MILRRDSSLNSNNFEKQSYNTLFSILDKYYDETKNNSLGALLGSMNPELFCDSNSADPAVFEDFCECIKTIMKRLLQQIQELHI